MIALDFWLLGLNFDQPDPGSGSSTALRRLSTRWHAPAAAGARRSSRRALTPVPRSASRSARSPAHPAAPVVMDDGRLFQHRAGRPSRTAVRRIAAGFVQASPRIADRPACRDDVRLGAHQRVISVYEGGARPSVAVRRARLGGHHRRRARYDGGRQQGREGGRRQIHRSSSIELPHNNTRTPTPTFRCISLHFFARKVCFVKSAAGS